MYRPRHPLCLPLRDWREENLLGPRK
uniref:Uncharacterized protein n=1 Tax=Rhizophora mucronata TaxID=61149 RepID=A0A2P2QT60_RHIMU